MNNLRKYKQKFLIDQNGDNSLTVKWKQGLFDFEVYHNEELIHEESSGNKLMNGIEIFNDKLGNISVCLVKEPIGFEVKIGDRYLFNSRIRAEEKLTTVSALFYFVGIISTIVTTFYISMNLTYITDVYIMFPYAALAALSVWYIISGHLIKKGYLWVYFVSTIFFALITLLYLVSYPLAGVAIHIIRISFLVIIVLNGKHIIALNKHRKEIRKMEGKSLINKDLLDNI